MLDLAENRARRTDAAARPSRAGGVGGGHRRERRGSEPSTQACSCSPAYPAKPASVRGLLAPVEVARTAPEVAVERRPLGDHGLDSVLARPRKGQGVGAQFDGGLAVEGLLDPSLLLRLEQRVIL